MHIFENHFSVTSIINLLLRKKEVGILWKKF